MSNLWIFGDSFSIERPIDLKNYDSLLWHEELGELLKVNKVLYSARPGVANSFIFSSFIEKLSDIDVDNDFILIQLTSPHRKWFFKEHPELGNYSVVFSYNDDKEWLEKNNLTSNHIESLKKYMTDLVNDEEDMIFYQSIFYSLNYIRIMSKIKNILIIPGFTPIPGFNGTLVDISLSEFFSESDRENWYKIYNVDKRPNHLSQENHKILANKLYEIYQDTENELDLKFGFKSKFLKVY